MGASIGSVVGTDSDQLARWPARSSPDWSLSNSTRAPRDTTSSRFYKVRSNSSSLGATTITGVCALTSAIGPCFSSPAAKPSAWM